MHQHADTAHALLRAHNAWRDKCAADKAKKSPPPHARP
jgi:hypothetical protein